MTMKKHNEEEARVCLNCKHKWTTECTLFDELVEDNGSCFMHDWR